jgi:FimV-like protein
MSKTKKILIVAIAAVVLIVVTVAVIVINKPSEVVTDSAASHISLAENYLLDLNYEAAIAEYRVAIEIDPKNADYYVALAEVYVEMGDIDGAIAVLEEGLASVEETDRERINAILEKLNPIPEETSATTVSFTPIQTTTTTVTEATTTTIATTTTTVPETTTVTTTTATPSPVSNDITNRFPDSNFRAVIREALGIGENDPIMSFDVAQVKELYLTKETDRPNYWLRSSIKDITGIEYFTSLEVLDCKLNLLESMPDLPNTIVKLDCRDNNLKELPELPKSLTTLLCEGNQLVELPELPDSLVLLWCDHNSLSNLPVLPDNLTSLWCSYNDNLDMSKTTFRVGSTVLERESKGMFDWLVY